METILKFNLEGMGHNVVGCAQNGGEAFEKYKELKPDLVLMDFMLPKVGGKEGIKLIINFDKNAKTIKNKITSVLYNY